LQASILPEHATFVWHIAISPIVAHLQQHSIANSTPPFSITMSVQAPPTASEGLRERNVAQTAHEEQPSSGSSAIETPQDDEDVEKEQKTFGRTPSGTSKCESQRSCQ